MELDVQSLTPLTMAELKHKLEGVKKESKEVNFRAAKVLDFLNEMPIVKLEKAEDVRKKIAELNVPRLKPKHIAKIIDIMPEDPDELKSLLVGENITVKNDDLVKIIEVLKA